MQSCLCGTCSIDLRSLQSQNAFNVIPPNSRATNYVVLKYYDVKGEAQVSLSLSLSLCNYTNALYI
jgi:hypothetical protein